MGYEWLTRVRTAIGSAAEGVQQVVGREVDGRHRRLEGQVELRVGVVEVGVAQAEAAVEVVDALLVDGAAASVAEERELDQMLGRRALQRRPDDGGRAQRAVAHDPATVLNSSGLLTGSLGSRSALLSVGETATVAPAIQVSRI